MRLVNIIQKAVELWEATQVELHGFYSVERARELINYSQQTSLFRSLVILSLIPWPCVIITILVDLIPLRPPSEGLRANHLFIVRTFLAFWVATMVINLQFKHSVPSAPLPKVRILISGAFTAILTTGAMYALSLAIGFPLPFGIITSSPAWVAFMLLPLASFVKKARADPAVWLQIVNTLKTWVCQESLVVIYPTYFYIFTTLPTDGKTPFAMMLPIIKIILRNVMSRTVVHLKDEIPEVVLMNVEVFNSLFMSYCMQNTPSIWTTLGLIAVDGAQMMASLHDVGVVIERLQRLKVLVNSERSRQGLSPEMRAQMKASDDKPIFVYTEEILDRYKSMPGTEVDSASARTDTQQVTHLNVNPKPMGFKASSKHSVYSPRALVRPKLVAGRSLRKIFSTHSSGGGEDKVDISQLELEYAAQVRKMLYITEFMILINYVEVIVPIIFWIARFLTAANLVVMYQLPNRVYYSQIDSMDDEKLWQTLGNVMLYCFLQVVSLVILFLVLWYRLRISGLRQLSFVLEKQGEQVQTKLVLWVFYNVQATLQHFGTTLRTCLPTTGEESLTKCGLLLSLWLQHQITLLSLLGYTVRLHDRKRTTLYRKSSYFLGGKIRIRLQDIIESHCYLALEENSE